MRRADLLVGVIALQLAACGVGTDDQVPEESPELASTEAALTCTARDGAGYCNTWKGTLKNGASGYCMDSLGGTRTYAGMVSVYLNPCNASNPNQQWELYYATSLHPAHLRGVLRNVGTGKCLYNRSFNSYNRSGTLELVDCNGADYYQRWSWDVPLWRYPSNNRAYSNNILNEGRAYYDHIYLYIRANSSPLGLKEYTSFSDTFAKWY